MSSGKGIRMIKKLKSFSLNNRLRGFEMLYIRELTHILPEGNEYKDHRAKWNLDVSASRGWPHKLALSLP